VFWLSLHWKDFFRQDKARSSEAEIYNPNNAIHPCVVHTFQFAFSMFIYLQGNYFTGCSPRSSRINLTILLNIGITGPSETKQTCQPSGSTPRHTFMVPASPSQDCRIIFDQVVIDALRTQIPKPREESMRG
jgi:hypothetical protein